VTVITPSYFSSFFLRRAFAAHGLINVELMRIEDFAERLAERALLDHGTRSLTRLRAAELVHAAAAATGSRDPMAGIAGQPSFHTALHRSLSELEAERRKGKPLFAPDHLTSLGPIPNSLAGLWERYESAKTTAGLHDRTTVAHEASAALAAGALSTPEARIQFGTVIALLIATPAAQYRELWRTLVSAPGVVAVAGLTGDERSDAALLRRAGLPHPELAPTGRPAGPARLVAASDIRSELAAVTRQIIADAREGGVPFNRMAVLYGDRAYASRIDDALTFAKIPVSGPDTYPVSATPAGRFLTGLLQIIESDFSREKLGHWLSSTPIMDPATGKPVPGSRWDGVSRSAGITGSSEQWLTRLDRFATSQTHRAALMEASDDGDGDSFLRASALRSQAAHATSLRQFVATLMRDLEPPGKAEWSVFQRWAEGLIGKYLSVAPGLPADDDVKRVMTVLQRIGELDSLSSEPPGFDRFARTVADELDRASSGLRSLGRGVFVAPLRDAAGCQFDRVHIVGMADGSFPSADNPDPLLPDDLRHRLNTSHNAELPLAADRLAARRREFHAALRSAPLATLYWPKSSGAGSREAGPAQWLVDEARRRPGAERTQAGAFLTSPGSIAGLVTASGSELALAADEHEYDLVSVSAHVKLEQPSPPHFLRADPATGIAVALELELGRYGRDWSEWAGDLSGLSGAGPAMAPALTSASRVQTYAACPLRYFFGYVLAVEPAEKPEEAIYMPPDRRGSFVHKVLELYLGLRIDERKPADGGTLDAAFEAAKAEWLTQEPVANRTVWEVETAELRRKLGRWLAAERGLVAAGFEPAGAEVRFGMGDKPPVEVNLSDGTVMRFSGIIDRVDKGPNGVYHIFDYKTGGAAGYSNLATDPVDGGKRLQLALYSLAVRQSDSNAIDTRASYWFVLDPRQKMEPEPSEFDQDRASERLSEVAFAVKSGIESGQFPPNPGKPAFPSFEACRYCEFDRVCPSSLRRERMLSVHKNAPALRSYFAMAKAESEDAE
jgi:RecB family exonuclease